VLYDQALRNATQLRPVSLLVANTRSRVPGVAPLSAAGQESSHIAGGITEVCNENVYRLLGCYT
jgi:hypothetical protein